MEVLGNFKRIDCLFVVFGSLGIHGFLPCVSGSSNAGFIANGQEHGKCIRDQAFGKLKTIQLKI